jgi:hypothetical protein
VAWHHYLLSPSVLVVQQAQVQLQTPSVQQPLAAQQASVQQSQQLFLVSIFILVSFGFLHEGSNLRRYLPLTNVAMAPSASGFTLQ